MDFHTSQGTRLEVRLPWQERYLKNSGDNLSTSQPIRVLVVDDHEMVRRGLVSYLETEDGIEVVGEASDGSQAVKFCRDLTPDVILMDLIMQETDGITATKEIKAEFLTYRSSYLQACRRKTNFPRSGGGGLELSPENSTAEEIVRPSALPGSPSQSLNHRLHPGW